jgi:hypothetical protein
MGKRHGGVRNGSGRKSKAEEMGLPALIEEVIGEDGKRDLIRIIYEKAKTNSFLHQQLLMHYIFGKPGDSVDITSKGQQIEGVKEIIFRNYADKP